jgi:hypothetical protein
MVARQEVQLVPENVMRSLPERTAILFRPGKLAVPLYTCWVPVKPDTLKEIAEQAAQDKARAEEKKLEAVKNDNGVSAEKRPEPQAKESKGKPGRNTNESAPSAKKEKGKSKKKPASETPPAIDAPETHESAEEKAPASLTLDDVVIIQNNDAHHHGPHGTVEFDDV